MARRSAGMAVGQDSGDRRARAATVSYNGSATTSRFGPLSPWTKRAEDWGVRCARIKFVAVHPGLLQCMAKVARPVGVTARR